MKEMNRTFAPFMILLITLPRAEAQSIPAAEVNGNETVLTGDDASSGESAFIRPVPLPGLRISRRVTDGRPITEIDGELPYRRELSEQAARTIADLIGPAAPAAAKKTKLKGIILEVDQGFPSRRGRRNLREILEGSFAREDWQRAEEELSALSASGGAESELRSRIHFYRGQAFYFLDRPYMAFIAFLIAADHYYLESRTWMLRIYADLTPVS